MLDTISAKIIDAMDSQHLLKHDSKAIYIYGLGLALYTFFSTAGLLLVGVAFSRSLETTLFIFTFYINQSFGGGFHASSHFRCFISMLLGVLHLLLSFLLSYNGFFYYLLFAGSFFILWFFPLVLHPNKKYLAKKASQFIHRSRLVLLTELTFFLICIFLKFPYNILQTLSVAMSFGALSRYIAVRGKKNLVFKYRKPYSS